MANSIIKQIRDFYNSYRTLNPSLNKCANSSKEISKELLEQKIFNYGIPEFDWKKCKYDLSEFDPFDPKSSLYFENLTYLELIRYRHFWNLAKTKLRKIINILNKSNYLKSNDLGKLVYNSNVINKTSILIAPELYDLQKDQNSDIKSHLKRSISKRAKICLKSDKFKIIMYIGITDNDFYKVSVLYVEKLVNNISYTAINKQPKEELISQITIDLQNMFNINCNQKEAINYIPLTKAE